MKKIFPYFLLSLLFLLPSAATCFALGMHSSDYTITIDSINFGGDYSTSTSYTNQDTLGEIATGNSSSTNYSMNAGYQQMYTSYISISTISPLTLSDINGLFGGVSTGTLAMTITTDNPAGYSLSVLASSSPALQSAAHASLSDYVSASSTSPDFAFTMPVTSSSFGFTVNSPDALSKYLNNGSICGTGSTNTAFACWDGFSTTTKIIAQSSGSNNPAGTLTNVDLEAKIGTSKIQDNGTYTATLTFTAVTL
jgi:hypothetical protein